ncbi:archaeal heat shock protein Hsp14 [Haloferacaceae archaeon DSL9]
MRRSAPFDEIERFFDHFGRGFGDVSYGSGAMDIDIADYDDELVVMADLPGFDREDIDLTINDRMLTIRAERHFDTDSDGGSYLRRERRTESVSRRVQLPDEVREADAAANYKNGVLTVTLPKRDAGMDDDDGRTIDIE